MSRLILIRHAQASFSRDPVNAFRDYDELSELGQKQADRLAEAGEQLMHLVTSEVGDIVVVNPQADLSTPTLGMGQATVTAADTLTLQLINPTAGALDPTSVAVEVLAFRIKSGT